MLQLSELNLPIPVHFSSLISKISGFTLAVPCLISSNLPWFTDLTFQVPMQYCSLQHWTSLSPPNTSTTEHCFHFGTFTSFFMDLLAIALCSSPVQYLTPSDLGCSSSSVIAICLTICTWGSWGKNTGIVCHSLLQWTMFYQNSPPCFWELSEAW